MPTDTEGEAAVEDIYAPQSTPKTRSEIVREIRNSDRTYFIRNNTNSRVTCSTSEPPLSLGPAGQGQDVAILPKSALDVPGVQRMWAQGKLTITDDQSVEDEMISGSALAEAREKEQRDKLFGQAEIEEPSSNRDLVEKKCLISGERVYQTVADIKNMVPPLAPAHKDRAHEFTPTVSLDERGQEVVKFSRVTIEK